MTLLDRSSIRRTPQWKNLLSPFRELGEPLFRNGHALVLSSVVTSVLGFLFWVLAARGYLPATVGNNSAALSVLTFLGGVAQLNLATVLVRFIPTAGSRRTRLIVSAYVVGITMSVALSVAFLTLVTHLIPSLAFINKGWPIRIWWIISTITWAIFVLEDGALTGLRRAPWVPIENAAFSTFKAALVVPLAGILHSTGIFYAWSIATLLTVLPTNLFLFGRAVPQEQRRDPAGDVTIEQLVRYIPFDSLAAFAWLTAVSLLPLMIVHRLGATANAFYSFDWLITYVLYLVSINLGSSLIVEAATDVRQLEHHSRRVIAHLAKLLGPIIILVVAGAPIILELFGRAYASAGVTTLRLLALSAFPFIITSTAVSALRARRKTRQIFMIDGTLCATVMVSTWVLLPHLGILGGAVAWLSAQCLAAILLIFFSRSWLGSSLLFGELSARVTVRIMRLFAESSLAQIAIKTRARWNQRESNRFCCQILPELLSEVKFADYPVQDLIHNGSVTPSLSDTTVALLKNRDDIPLAVVKIARSEQGRTDIRNGAKVLTVLREDERLGDWRDLLPPCSLHANRATTFSIEPAIPGISAEQLIHDSPWLTRNIIRVSLSSISRLHAATSQRTRIDEGFYWTLIGNSLELLRRSHPSAIFSARQNEAVDILHRLLHAKFCGLTLLLSRIHGDFSPGNILLTRDATHATGILDWGQGKTLGIPAVDALNFVAAVHCQRERIQFGSLVTSFLNHPKRAGDELFQLSAPITAPTNLPYGDLMMICWLNHITGNITKSGRYTRSLIWWSANVEPIFDAVMR